MPGIAQEDPHPGNGGGYALPGNGDEVPGKGELLPTPLRGADDRLAQGMLGAIFRGCRQAEYLRRAEAGGGQDVRHFGTAFCEGPRLVENDGVYLMGGLQSTSIRRWPNAR